MNELIKRLMSELPLKAPNSSQKTLFKMIIQSKSNILSPFQNFGLIFTAKDEFLENS